MRRFLSRLLASFLGFFSQRQPERTIRVQPPPIIEINPNISVRTSRGVRNVQVTGVRGMHLLCESTDDQGPSIMGLFTVSQVEPADRQRAAAILAKKNFGEK